ncbi:MAG: sulfite exporter TauE/SafE family protein [Hyphomicrobiaceae bacterium]|nr:sulfite exporter TauE/SafE family protein [Hyphomicrobiaceae bacterium]
MDLMTYLPLVVALVASGIVAGIMAGLLGVGGGIVMVPAMALTFGFLGFDPEVYQHVSVGTSLAIIISTGLMSARAHHQRGAVMVDVLKLWGVPIVVASLLGGLMARIYSGDTLRIIFGVVAIFLAFNVVLPVQKMLMASLGGSKLTNRISAFVVGYISALMGIGGGSLSVPTLSAFGNPMHKAVGTGAALGVLIAIPGALGFVISGWTVDGRPPFSLGYINIPAMIVIGVAAAIAAPYGAALAHRLDKKQLERVFAVFLLIVGLRMLWQAIS